MKIITYFGKIVLDSYSILFAFIYNINHKESQSREIKTRLYMKGSNLWSFKFEKCWISFAMQN